MVERHSTQTNHLTDLEKQLKGSYKVKREKTVRFTHLFQSKRTKRDWRRTNLSESWFLFLLESSFPWRVSLIPAISSIRVQDPKFPMI